jgi:hypothetical protein
VWSSRDAQVRTANCDIGITEATRGTLVLRTETDAITVGDITPAACEERSTPAAPGSEAARQSRQTSGPDGP